MQEYATKSMQSLATSHPEPPVTGWQRATDGSIISLDYKGLVSRNLLLLNSVDLILPRLSHSANPLLGLIINSCRNSANENFFSSYTYLTLERLYCR